MALEPIDPSLLQAVCGGEMQFHPSLVGTLEAVAHRKPPDPNPPAMQKLKTTLTTAVSNLATSMSQSKQQSSQAMMQMLPQLMRR